MTIIYRISKGGYAKQKIKNVNNAACLLNAWDVFRDCAWLIIADGITEPTSVWFDPYPIIKGLEKSHGATVQNVTVGHGAGTFNLALDYVLELHDAEVVYFLESDYIHLPTASAIIKEGISMGADYVSGYDHPDKYLAPELGGNPEVEGGGELTRVMLSKSSHWKLTNSTTMTFAARVKTLREDEDILRKFTTGTYPRDYDMFLALRDKGRSLITPIPGVCTHGETDWASPLTNWEAVILPYTS